MLCVELVDASFREVLDAVKARTTIGNVASNQQLALCVRNIRKSVLQNARARRKLTSRLQELRQEIRTRPVRTRLEFAMDVTGFTNQHVGEASGLTRSRIEYYRGGGLPTIEKAIRIAHVFGMTADFFFGEGDSTVEVDMERRHDLVAARGLSPGVMG